MPHFKKGWHMHDICRRKGVKQLRERRRHGQGNNLGSDYHSWLYLVQRANNLKPVIFGDFDPESDYQAQLFSVLQDNSKALICSITKICQT